MNTMKSGLFLRKCRFYKEFVIVGFGSVYLVKQVQTPATSFINSSQRGESESKNLPV